MMNPIKVLVVDDSAFMRALIKDLLSNNKRIKVIGTARNGLDALDKIKKLNPDVVTLDVEMPVMDGIDALKKIMSESPLPVIMVSSTTTEGAKNTILAMQYGAFDFIAKPSGSISLDLYKVKDELINRILETKRVNLKQLVQADPIGPKPLPTIDDDRKQWSIPKTNSYHRGKKLVLIGTSTGGPRALEKVLTRLPGNLQAPILVVQHMPKGFTKSLAERLDAISEIHVKEAENGEILQNGVAYIAPGGLHLVVRKVGKTLVTELSTEPPLKGHRPSVDKLFSSASQLRDYQKVAVIMTGMGSDGTEGLKQLKQSKNIYAIAESEKTAIIFGMPKSAINSGYIDCVTDLEKIADQITKIINEG